ncbi:hypothetical protein Tco_0162735 [Tanacetum coccineum]
MNHKRQGKIRDERCEIQSIADNTLQVVGAKAMVVGRAPQTIEVNWIRISYAKHNGTGYSQKDKTEAKTDKIEHEMERA